MRTLHRAAQDWFAEGPRNGAAISFHIVLALAPMCGLLAAAASMPRTVRADLLFGISGSDWPAPHALMGALASLWGQPHGALVVALGVAMTLFGAIAACMQLRRTLNVMAGVASRPVPRRGSLRAQVVAWTVLAGVALLALVSLLQSVVVAHLSAQLGDLQRRELVALLDVALSTALFTPAFAAVLRCRPDVPPNRRALWTGAACAALLFGLSKHAFGLGLAQAGSVGAGGTAGLLALLWIYASVQSLLFGAALARVLEDGGIERRAPRGRGAATLPPVEQPLPSMVQSPVSLAAVRLRMRFAAPLTVPRRQPPSWENHGVLLRFPSERRARHD